MGDCVKPARRQATYDDVRDASDLLVAELIEGDLYTSPRPAMPHARAASALGQDLRSFDEPPGDADTPGGWWIIDEPELHFGADVLVPDLAGWRRERMPSFPDTAAVTLAPDWACEILSPTTATLDRTRKMPIYARNGVAHLWLIDPTARTLEVYRLEGERWMVASSHGGSTSVRAEPFAAIDIDMRRWWGER
jgi:Uma2 family endonuclease